MTVAPPGPAAPGKAWRAANVLVMTLGQICLFAALLLLAEYRMYLETVDPRHPVTGPGLVDAGDWFQAVNLGFLLVSLVLVAGLPSDRRHPQARPGAIGQAVAGLSVIVTTLLGHAFMNSLYFAKPEYVCVYPSCWPVRQQTVGLVIPMIITGLVLIAAAFLVRRWAWWVRVLVPLVTWVVLLLVHHWLWYAWLLPIFERPPS